MTFPFLSNSVPGNFKSQNMKVRMFLINVLTILQGFQISADILRKAAETLIYRHFSEYPELIISVDPDNWDMIELGDNLLRKLISRGVNLRVGSGEIIENQCCKIFIVDSASKIQ